MARWEPNTADRLSRAALDLFAERGYEQTSVIDIARRAGLGKTTFFRHFPDKREVLFGGSETDEWLIEAVASAPQDATALEAVARVLDAAGTTIFSLARRSFVIRRQAVISANPELQERDALKSLRLTAAMADALRRRGIDTLTAQVTAQLGALASSIAIERWGRSDEDVEFGVVARQALTQAHAAVAACAAV